MNAEALITVSAAIVALTQLVKWGGLPDAYGPLAVMGFSLLGVLFWGWGHDTLTRAASFEYFAGWITVTTSASGVYGFTRAGAAALTKVLPPPATGAGSESTDKR
jgi:hypothetical protein